MKYKWIQEHEAQYPMKELCEAMQIQPGSYYKWLRTKADEYGPKDQICRSRIESIYKESKGRYGHRPMYYHLKEEGVSCGRDKTLRLMQDLGLSGTRKKSYKPIGTNSKHEYGYYPNLLKDKGEPGGINQVWVSDTTYLLTEDGWRYLATVMDLHSRKILGWQISNRNNTELINQALGQAIMHRGGSIKEGIIHHSDRGSTYASHGYEKLLNQHRFKKSMSAKGNCYDNAAMESFYGRFKASSVRDKIFTNQSELQSHVFEYIEVFYNRFRKHSSLGYISPNQFEEKFCPPRGAGADQGLLA
jgi:putative transposase